jgi:hypothetical protein
MSSELPEKSFEYTIERGFLRYGPDACAEDSTALRENPDSYGEVPPGGYHRRAPEDYEDLRSLREAQEAEKGAPTIGMAERKKKIRGRTRRG